jgi:hypothetical protein
MAEEGMLTKPAPATKEDVKANQTFTFVKGIETGKGSQDYLYGQEGEVQQLTTDQLRDYFEGDNVNRLQEQFGTFDNYLAYMTEREQLIQSGQYDVGNWSEADAGFTEDQEMILEGDADLTIDPSDPTQNFENIRRQQTGAQSGAYENWLNSDVNQQLLQKYGVGTDIYSESGDRFKWNGTAYVKVEDATEGVGQYALAGMAALAGSFLGPGLASALGGPTAGAGGFLGIPGAASGAAGGASGLTAGGFASAAAGNALSNAIIQGVTTGSVDISSLGEAAISGGLGYIGDVLKANALQIAQEGSLGEIAAGWANELDRQIWNMSDALNVPYDTVYQMGTDIANGVLSGQDIEEIARNTLQTYTTNELQDFVVSNYGDLLGNTEVQNAFREGETSIPIAALNPLIETAVGGAFGEDLNTEDVLNSIYEGLTYRDPDSPNADMTLSFLDPRLDLEGTPFDVDLSGLGDLIPDEVREFGREFEDTAREFGRAIDESVYQPLRPGLRAIDQAVVQPIGQALSDAETAVRQAIPDTSLPEGPDIDLPDGPDINLPDMPSRKKGQFSGAFKPLNYSIGYTPVQLQQQVKPDYAREFDGMLTRLMQGRTA